MLNITFRLAWRNLWRQPRRTLLTLAAMVFSNTILAFMISFQLGMYDLMIENTLAIITGHAQVQAEGYKDDARMRQSIPGAVDIAQDIRDRTEFETVAVRGNAFALASSAERSFGIRVIGVEPDHEPGVSTLPGLVTEGRYLSDPNAWEAVVGSVLARNLRVSLGDEVTLLGSGRDGSFAAAVVTIAGIIDSGITDLDRSVAQMPLATFQETFYMEDHAHEIVLKAATLTDAPIESERVRKLIPDSNGLVVHEWDALQPGLRQSITADLFSAWFMYGVLIALVAFSVLNTVLMSVLERTREFGIVMSLGLTPGRLGRLVFLETAIMGLMGLTIGVGVGAVLVAWAGHSGISFPGMDEMNAQFNMPSRLYPQLNIWHLSLGPAFVLLATMLASLWPALRLHWLHPVQAMRAA